MIQLSSGLFGGMGMSGGFKGANLSHTIHHLSFGDAFPGKKDPLDQVCAIHMRY